MDFDKEYNSWRLNEVDTRALGESSPNGMVCDDSHSLDLLISVTARLNQLEYFDPSIWPKGEKRSSAIDEVEAYKFHLKKMSGQLLDFMGLNNPGSSEQ